MGTPDINHFIVRIMGKIDTFQYIRNHWIRRGNSPLVPITHHRSLRQLAGAPRHHQG